MDRRCNPCCLSGATFKYNSNHQPPTFPPYALVDRFFSALRLPYCLPASSPQHHASHSSVHAPYFAQPRPGRLPAFWRRPFPWWPDQLVQSSPAGSTVDISPTTSSTSSLSIQTTASLRKRPRVSAAGGQKREAAKVCRRYKPSHYDDYSTAPISGIIIDSKRTKGEQAAAPDSLVDIRTTSHHLLPKHAVVRGDIDRAENRVEVTETARAELAKIDNRLGPYECRLCETVYPDAFQLAEHRCPRILHIEYCCPDCNKVFNCPANLASHRRWHKPRLSGQSGVAQSDVPASRQQAKTVCDLLGQRHHPFSVAALLSMGADDERTMAAASAKSTGWISPSCGPQSERGATSTSTTALTDLLRVATDY